MKTDATAPRNRKRHPVRQIFILLIALCIAMGSAGITGQVVMYDGDNVPVAPAADVPEDVNSLEDEAFFVRDTKAISQQETSIISDNAVSPESVSGMSIRDILGQNMAELSELTYINAGEMGITDLSGIEVCTSLHTLILWDNEISDISLLSNLPNLTYLFLGGNRISDLSPLSYLPNLSELYIWHNQISDLSPLSESTNLTRLDIQYNQVTDLSPLENLANLEWICVLGNQIEDLSCLPETMDIYLNDI